MGTAALGIGDQTHRWWRDSTKLPRKCNLDEVQGGAMSMG